MIAAGAIVAGFCATFLQFRLQREATYYRKGKQLFSSSFLLIILATLMALFFGVVLPLIRLSGIGQNLIRVQSVVAGLLDSIILLLFYFLDEFIHYNIFPIERKDWHRELPVVVAAMAVGVLFPMFWMMCAR
jgi:hypothetical protein